MLSITWIDHSESEQQRVRELLKLFEDKGTVDDLGIGVVRDAFSEAFFPGLSTTQTRARYLLFVPWIYQEAEQRRVKNRSSRANVHERKLIAALRHGGDERGLIGRVAGEQVKTLPSSIYWGGLRTFGIFQRPDLSFGQYQRAMATDHQELDDEDELAERSITNWHRDVPKPPDDFFEFESCDFRMRRAEAEWLAERFMVAKPQTGFKPLLADITTAIQTGDWSPPPPGKAGDQPVWDFPLPKTVGTERKRVIEHAGNFARAVEGATLVYNLILSEKQAVRFDDPANSIEALKDDLEYWAELNVGGLQAWATDRSQFWKCVHQLRGPVPIKTAQFVDGWLALIAKGKSEATGRNARTLIERRELAHKGPLARLANPKRLAQYEGNAGAPLSYRWEIAVQFANDLNDGMHNSEDSADAVS